MVWNTWMKMTAVAAVLALAMAAGPVMAQQGTPSGKGVNYVDADGDGVCDNYGTSACNGCQGGKGQGKGQGVCDGTGKGQGKGKGQGVCDGSGKGQGKGQGKGKGTCDGTGKGQGKGKGKGKGGK
ncbi:MAG: hypothetical protein AMXMBFR82_50880 [Candidatus Hydrogenedentota bacterium]